MSEGNSIQGSFGVSLAPLRRDMAEAPRIARDGAAQATLAMKTELAKTEASARGSMVNWRNLAAERQRYLSPPPGRQFRAARPGQYPAPEEDDSGAAAGVKRLRGLGEGLTLLAGLRMGAAYFERVNQEAFELSRKIEHITRLTGSGAFRGVGEMETDLREAAASLDEIYARKSKETRSGTTETDERGIEHPSPMRLLGLGVRSARQFFTGDTDANEDEQKNRLRKKAGDVLDELGKKQTDLNRATQEGFSGSERESALLEEQIKHRERLGQLAAAEVGAGANNPAARNAENDRSRLAIDVIERTAAAKQSQIESEIRLGELRKAGVDQETRAYAAVKEKLALIRSQLQQPQTEESRDQLSAQRLNLEGDAAEMRRAHMADRPRPLSSTTVAARDRDREFGPGGFTRRAVEDSLGWGGLARRQLDSGLADNADQALGQAGIGQTQVDAYKKNVGNLPGGDVSPQILAELQKANALMEKVWASP